jgi:hypothetical protein
VTEIKFDVVATLQRHPLEAVTFTLAAVAPESKLALGDAIP